MSDERKQVTKEVHVDVGNSAAGPSQIQHTVAAPDPLASAILKLDVDCFEELFEWLPLADLRALRQTCKRLKQVVDFFIRTNYPAVKIGFGRIELNTESDFDLFKKLDPIKKKMIREANVGLNEMTDETIDDMKGILPQLETLEFFEVKLQTNFYESILMRCSNLKCLRLEYMVFNKENPDEDSYWLKHPQPTIESLEIYYDEFRPSGDLKEIGTFLKLNPNIQTFSICSEVLAFYGDCFIGSNIKIHRLNVSVVGDDVFEDILDQLYEQGFHKRLHLYVDGVADHASTDRIALIRGLEKIYFFDVKSNAPITLPQIPGLRELCFDDYDQPRNVDMDSMAKNLINLERVYFENGSIDSIFPFIRFAPKVKEIKVNNLEEGAHFENGIVDLLALNKERNGLASACKVTIYVKESVFLSTKFATTKAEFNLITLKRAEAVEWTHKEIVV